MTVQRGLSNILSSGTEFIKFEDGKPKTLLFIDWGDDLLAIREHYEPTLKPKYIRCPGKDVCPLCAAGAKYPALRIKFRVYDPEDQKVKLVSLAKSHVKKLHTDFQLDEIDPTEQYVKIIRSGKGASDTTYAARASKDDYPMPNFDDLDMPDIEAQVTPHTPEQIRNIMNAITDGGGGHEGDSPAGAGQPANQGQGRGKLPF